MVCNVPCMQDLFLAIIVVAVHAMPPRSDGSVGDGYYSHNLYGNRHGYRKRFDFDDVGGKGGSYGDGVYFGGSNSSNAHDGVLVATDFMVAIRFVVERIMTAPFMVMMVTAVCMMVMAFVAGAVVVETTIHRPAHVCLLPLLSLRIFAKPA